jgi:hypothetical protein
MAATLPRKSIELPKLGCDLGEEVVIARGVSVV